MRGPTSKGKEGGEEMGGEGEKRRERKRLREGREGKGKVGRGRERGVLVQTFFGPVHLTDLLGRWCPPATVKICFLVLVLDWNKLSFKYG